MVNLVHSYKRVLHGHVLCISISASDRRHGHQWFLEIIMKWGRNELLEVQEKKEPRKREWRKRKRRPEEKRITRKPQ